MNKIRLFTVAITCAAAMSVLSPSMSATEWDKRTTVTFTGEVEVPGTVLEPGRYVMKLMDSPADRHIVQFSNERENHVFATVLAIPSYRLTPSEKTIFTFYEAPVGQPQAMRTWFYPGDNTGEEFVYPKARLAALLAGANHGTSFTTVALTQPEPPVSSNIEEPATPAEPAYSPAAPDASSYASAPPAIDQKPDNEPVTIAQNTAPAPPSDNVADKSSDDSNKTLPKTASNFWEIALLGLGSIGAAGGVRVWRLRRRIN
jgi:hypothetical protein